MGIIDMQLPLSTLQLEHYHLRGISVIAQEHPDIKVSPTQLYPTILKEDIEIDIVLTQPDGEEDPHNFIVSLTVASPENSRDALPYKYGAHIEGMFSISDDGELEARKQLVVINGGSMLFGIVREQILAMTMRQINGPMMLPSLSFRGLIPDLPATNPVVAQPAAESRATKRKPTIREAASKR